MSEKFVFWKKAAGDAEKGRDGKDIEDAEFTDELALSSDAPSTREEKLVANQDSAERAHERDSKADALVERYPELKVWREKVLEAESSYKDSVREYKSQGLKIPFREYSSTKDAHREFTASLMGWRNSLIDLQSRADVTAQDKILAKFVGIRDTALRMERVRQEAIREGLDERGKTVVGKMLNWSRSAAKGAGAAAGAATQKFGAVSNWTGKKIVGGALAAGDAVGLSVDREKHASKIVHANKIVGSAAILSLLVAPAAAATGAAAATTAGIVSFDFIKRVVRGTVSAQAVAGIQTLAEVGFSALEGGLSAASERARTSLRAYLRDDASGKDSIDDFYAERDLYTAASLKRRLQNEKFLDTARNVSRVVSTVGIGAGSYAVADAPIVIEREVKIQLPTPEPTPAASPALPADATPAELKQTLRESVEAISRQEASPEAGPQLSATESADTAAPTEDMKVAIDERGEGTDSLFLELKKEVGSLKNPSSVATLLSESEPNEISRLVGAEAYGEIGMRTQMGDSFYLDEKQNLMYKPAGGEAQLFIENDPSNPKGYVVHELSAEPTAPAVVEAETSSAEASVGVTPEEPTADTGEEEFRTEGTADEVVQQPVQERSSPLTIEDTITTETTAPSRVEGIEAVTPEMYAPEAAPDTGAAPSPEAPTVDSIDVSKSQLAVDQKGNLFAYVPRTGNMALDNQAAHTLAADAAIKNPGTPIYYVEQERGGFLGLRTIDRVHVLAVDPTKGPSPIEYEMPKNATYVVPEPQSLRSLMSRTA